MSNLDELQRRLAARRRVLDEAAGEARAMLSRAQELQAEIENLASESDVLERTSALLNTLGEERQAKAQGTIETLVTQGLQAIFDETLTFHITATTKAKTTTVDFVVRSTLGSEVVETPVLEARGGGLAATVGCLLRVVVMLLTSTPDRQNLLVLDETFAHVSAEYLEPLGQFLRQVVDRTGIQIIMVTHQPEFLDFADVAYRFTQDNGRTKAVAHVS